MKLLFVCLLVSAVALSACNKNEAPKNDSQATTQVATSANQAVQTPAPTTPPPSTDTSPTLLMYIETMKATTGMQLGASYPLSPEQTACLYSNDANATYLATAKEQLSKALGKDGLKASDEFYASELGQKLIKFTQQQLQQATGRPIEGEPITLTAEDEVKIVEFSQSDIGKKIEANTKNIDPQAMMKQMQAHLESEKTRCKIG